MGSFARNNDDQTFATNAAQLRQRRLKITDVLQRMRGYHRIETAIFERQGLRTAFVKPDSAGGGLERIGDDDVHRGDVMVFGQPLAEKAAAASDLQHHSTDHGVFDRRNASITLGGRFRFGYRGDTSLVEFEDTSTASFDFFRRLLSPENTSTIKLKFNGNTVICFPR